ncbi:MAG TPA: L,D-transpeptidase [Polyangiaceae bacterium]|nr:L,D-transpeptidase [Polyangiaceae bacterium]
MQTTVERAAQNAVKCNDRVPVYEGGAKIGDMCPEAALLAGHTLLDLSDDFVPHVLRGEGDGKVPSYNGIYAKLANEEFGEDADWDRAKIDRYFELYGVFPTLSVMRKRLRDEKRHKCHDAVSDEGLANLDEELNTWRPLEEQQKEAGEVRGLGALLKMAAGALKLDSIDKLDKSKTYGARYRHYKRLKTRGQAVTELQEHLKCEGLLDSSSNRAMKGILDRPTITAMQTYHRRHMLVTWQLDEETRTTLLTNSRELDFRTLLRTLRERVIDATGLIEDGTASGERGKVLGRSLDARAFLASPRPGEEASGEGAPDLISGATDAAARALGWINPRAFLKQRVPDRVAVKLPPRPAYHGEHMELRAVVDRGDVWYDFPYSHTGDRRLQLVENRPAITLYAEHEGREIALVRWPTTIGGWQPERIENGRIYLVYKDSPAGPRVWRDIIAEPRWIPPENTPERDLVRPRYGEGWALKNDTFGPHYASAYGLVMMVHHRVDGKPGKERYTDQGIRTHGSASYDSILQGESHGCHRLHNHRALRLSAFLLEHRHHQVRGSIPVGYSRYFEWRGKNKKLEFESRGFRYELTPPVPVEVTRGRVMGQAMAPLYPQKLTAELRERYANPG